jgi:hypothetical protein
LEYKQLADWRENQTQYQDKLKDPEYVKLLPNREEMTFEMMNNIMKSFGQQNAISAEQRKLQKKLMNRAAEWATKYDAYVAVAMLQVRRALTFKCPTKKYRDMLAASWVKSQALFERLMAEITKEDEAGNEENKPTLEG